MAVPSPLLINILGHAAGALIFAIFLALLYSRGGWPGARGRSLSALAAALSLLWNLGSLIVLAWPNLSQAVANIAAAFSFSVLSLLPAVLLHVSVRGKPRPLVWSGYILSSIAVVLHCGEAAGFGSQLHEWALVIITGGFLALAGAAAVLSAAGTRVVASMCLALFAMSFLHFGTGHASQAWSSELLVHHAGIPLALFVLLQDYRFVLLDAFIRFLANALLAALLTAVVIVAAFRLVLVRATTPDPLHQALLLFSVCVFLVCFAWLRNRVQQWLTRAVFRHGQLANLATQIQHCPEFGDEDQYLNWAAACMATAGETEHFAVAAQDAVGAATAPHAPVPAAAVWRGAAPAAWPWAEAVVPVRLGAGVSKLILLGGRKGGRRYLSEDFDALARAAAEIAARVETLRQQELHRLVTQAELRALQSQMNPHFLFNALNTLYGTIPRESTAARRIVLNLAEIFRYFLRSEKPFVSLAQEMEIVRAYLEVEQLRLGNRLTVEVDVEDTALHVPIPVLSVEPLVENAIKHGVASSEEPGYVKVRARLLENELRVVVENTGKGVAQSTGAGLGLRNVRRRLEICYGSRAALRLDFGPEVTTAELALPAAVTSAAGAR